MPLADRLGSCPGCDLPMPEGEPCPERACRQRGLHAIPAEHGLLLGADRDPQLGRVIADHLVVAVIGAGGFGRVYRAIALAPHPYAGRDVALKLATVSAGEHASGRDLGRQRLEREAAALARVDHPNVVRLLGAGVAGGAPWLAMEYLATGRSLDDELAARAERREPFASHEILHIVGALLEGLEAAHTLGLVHRDVKPENVMLVPGAAESAPDIVKLLDFGLVKLGADRGRSMALGTPTHMAPEQLAGRDLGPWTDLYAVGVIAFELLTGALPFDGETASAVLRERAAPQHDPFARAPDLAPPLAAFLARALAHDPADRFRAAREMRAALADALAAGPATHAAPAPRPRLSSSQRATLLEPAEDAAPPEPSLFDPFAPIAAHRPTRLDAVTRRLARLRPLGPLAPAAAAIALALLALAFDRGASSASEVGPESALTVVAAAPTALSSPPETAPSLAARALPPTAPAPPRPHLDAAEAATAEAERALVDRAASCTATEDELRALAERCRSELGCTRVAPSGDLARGVAIETAGAASVVLVVGGPGDAPSRCAGRWQRGRALVAGAWDEVDPDWGGYVAPRVVLEARRGPDLVVREVLAERPASRAGLATSQATLAAGTARCLRGAALGRGSVTLRALEELRFRAADTGALGEEGRSPCALPVLALYRVEPRPTAAMASRP